MKRRFKVIATAAVAVGVVGLASTGMAQDSRGPAAEAGLEAFNDAMATGCQNLASQTSRGGLPLPEGFAAQVEQGCAPFLNGIPSATE